MEITLRLGGGERSLRHPRHEGEIVRADSRSLAAESSRRSGGAVQPRGATWIADEAGVPLCPRNRRHGSARSVLGGSASLARSRGPRTIHANPLSSQFVAKFPNRVLNIHPSLLPYHPGANAYKQAWEEGVRVSGCTAHFATVQLDQGPVVLQDVFHIQVGVDTLEDVKAKGRALEGEVLSQAVQLFLNDQLIVKDNKVFFRPGRIGE